MRTIARMALAMFAAAATVLPATAQTIGSSGSTSGGSTSTGSTSSTITGGSSTTGGSSGSSGSSTPANQITLSPVEQIATINSVSAYTGTGATTSVISTSNPFARTYANPYWQGRAGAQANQVPGGFGNVLYNVTTGSTGGSIGYAGSTGSLTGQGGSTSISSALGRSTTGSTSGVRGSTSSTLGRTGGGVSSSSVSGIIVPMSRTIAYPAVLKFQAPAVPAATMHADIRGMLDRSTMITAPQNVQVNLEGDGVVLRGMAENGDEARMVEGMVRLTPGVRFVRNELTFRNP